MCKIQMNLHNELKKYGLNPTEWTLQKLARKRFKIVHIDDQAFYFYGETKKQGLLQQWETLQLISY